MYSRTRQQITFQGSGAPRRTTNTRTGREEVDEVDSLVAGTQTSPDMKHLREQVKSELEEPSRDIYLRMRLEREQIIR